MPPDDAPASPACLAHEADDGYMGFATREEIVQLLTALETAAPGARADMLRKMLPRIRDDVLHAELKDRLATIEADKSTA